MKENYFHSKMRAGIPRARARFLTQSMQLEEPQVSKLISSGLYVTSIFIIGLIVWSYYTPLKEVAHSMGEIVPAGRTHQVQHLEGGIVKAIHIHDGDQVRQGDVLIELNQQNNASELAQIEKREISLQQKLWRINALLEHDGSPFDMQSGEIPEMQIKLYNDQAKNYQEQIALIEAQRKLHEIEVTSKQRQIHSLNNELDAIKEQVSMNKSAELNNVVAKVKLLELDALVARTTSQLRDVESQIAVSRKSIAEAEQKKQEFISRWRQDLRLQAEDISTEISSMIEEASRSQDRLNRLNILAPVNGIVQALSVNSLNQVVEPGEVILEIIPMEDELVAETRIQPKDIGHIQAGQRVDIKVDSFEPQRFGSVNGSIRYVSATTFIDHDQKPYYKAEILLERNYVGNNPEMNQLLPGMTLMADIQTGEKTILQYILKPVYRGFSGAMQER